MKQTIDFTLRKAKRLITGIIGFTVLAVGIAMIVLPGPAVVVIPIGLGILATEFIWAKRLLQRVREHIEYLRNRNKTDKNDKP